MPYDICNICKKKYKKGETSTVRQSWIWAGGFGQVLDFVPCHPKCDIQEQRNLINGKIKLSDLYIKPRKTEIPEHVKEPIK